jgi:hypothetical protein
VTQHPENAVQLVQLKRSPRLLALLALREKKEDITTAAAARFISSSS